jgi:hypothetical protein
MRGSAMEVHAGVNIWPVSFVLPEGLPPTFSGTYGGSAFEIWAIVDLAQGAFQKAFNSAVLDINEVQKVIRQKLRILAPYKPLPYMVRGATDPRRPVLVSVEMPKQWVIGAPIDLKITLVNNSTTQIKAMSLQLVGFVTFHAQLTSVGSYRIDGNHYSRTEEVRALKVLSSSAGANRLLISGIHSR